MRSWGIFVSVASLIGVCLASSGAMASTLTKYQELVQDHRYREALNVACEDFGLPCDEAYFKFTADDPNGNYALTDLDGTIHLSAGAFRHPSEILPHEGWLAAVVGHELIHVRQGTFRRVYGRLEQIYASDNEYVAAQELEGWLYMMNYGRIFRLNWPMTLEVENNLEYYDWVMKLKGKIPDGSPAPNFIRIKAVRKIWESWKIPPTQNG